MTHGEFIKALGGATKIAKWLARETGSDIDREAIYKWSRNSVPWRWRPHLARLAFEQGIALPSDFSPRVAA